MTEDEAKTKWCPMVRGASEPSHAANVVKSIYTNTQSADSTPRLPHWAKCIADDCMMWRSENGVTVHGYCGLAGKPND